MRTGRNGGGSIQCKNPRVANREREKLRESLKEEIPSEIESMLVKSPNEMLKVLKPRNEENQVEVPNHITIHIPVTN